MKRRIRLTAPQRGVVQFRFTDVGHEWARDEAGYLVYDATRQAEVEDILVSAVDITRDWLGDPEGRGEHRSTKALLAKVEAAR